MIDALFGSKTRVKLLYLFLSSPGKSFYVREITRLVGEQINSVRRELSNMLNVGIITSDSADHKLYYEVDQEYEHYKALRAIFTDEEFVATSSPDNGKQRKTSKKLAAASGEGAAWRSSVAGVSGVRVAIASGSLVNGSGSKVDLLIAVDGDTSATRKSLQQIEKGEGRDLNYSILPYDEFYYRLSIRDKFITDIINNTHMVVVDTDNMLKG